MTKTSSVPAVAVCLIATASAAAQIVIDLPMDQQIDTWGAEAIYAPGGGQITFETDGADGWTRRHMDYAGWYDLEIDLTLAGEGVLDITGIGRTLEFDCRYFQDNGDPYADAPILLSVTSANGQSRNFSMVYQTGGGWFCDPIDRFPAWYHATIDLNDLTADYNCDGSPDVTEGPQFDPTRVTQVRFYGTDWSYIPEGEDWIDVKNLVIHAKSQWIPPVPYSVTPVLFIPNPASFPPGYQPTAAELDEDEQNVREAMLAIRDWYADALGLPTSLRVGPVVRMMATGGLGDYDIAWVEPEQRYADGIELGDTWGKVLQEVGGRGYGPGTSSAPRMIVIFCKGAGGFAGGAQWHAERGGGMCILGDWCLDSLAERVPEPWWSWWTGRSLQIGATAHEMGHTIGLPHPDALNPDSGEQDYPYTVMGAWWDWPSYPINPADPDWPRMGLHAWADNDYTWTVPGYQDIFLLNYRVQWFEYRPGDGDSDGDVDLDDHAEFATCLTGPGAVSAAEGCEDYDFDLDHDVDLSDFAAFLEAFSGAR
jgi:hypothetical protein